MSLQVLCICLYSVQVEIVNQFEGVEGLKGFKDWVMTPDKDIIAAAQRVNSRGRKTSGPDGCLDTDAQGQYKPYMSISNRH